MSQLYSEGLLLAGSKITRDHKLAGLTTGGQTGDVDMADGEDLFAALTPGAGLSSLEDQAITKSVSNESCESTVIDGTYAEKAPLRPNVIGFGTGGTSSPATSPSREPGDDDDDHVADGNPNKEGESKEVTAGHEGLNTSTPGSG